MPAKDAVAASYRQAHTAMLEALADMDDAAYRQRPKGNEWSIAQALAHVVEAQEFWLSQVERLVREPGARVGRLDERSQGARQRAIDEALSTPYGDMRARFERVAIAGQRRLLALSAEALECSGVRLLPGQASTATTADLFQQVADHIQEHADQIAELREAR